ncbi:hypothetical protein NT04LS_0584a, partial [Listeria seeligeri FSL S4-171]
PEQQSKRSRCFHIQSLFFKHLYKHHPKHSRSIR